MKLVGFHILFYFFLGVGTTIGVAWGLSLGYRSTWSWAQQPGANSRLFSAYRADVVWFVHDQSFLGARATETRMVWKVVEPGDSVSVDDVRGTAAIPESQFVLFRKRSGSGFGAPGAPVRIGTPETAPIPKWSAAKRYAFDPDGFGQREMITDRVYGLPMLALHYEAHSTVWNKPANQVSGGIQIRGVLPDQLVLPLRPILPGFLFNTAFYGIIWFGLFYWISATRRDIRRRHGRCVKCGYDLRGEFDNGCPECGWNRES